MSRNYCVYKHTSPSGKVYFGITSLTLERRCDNGRGYRLNPYFSRAILKYGWENFTHEIVAQGLTKDAACAMERELIAKHHSTDPAYGYNLMGGGEHYTHSLTSREKMSAAHMGLTASEETRAKMSAHYAGGRPRKPVRCIDTGVVYPNINTAARATGADRRKIVRVCDGQRRTTQGLHWEYVKEERDFECV